jgi:hypothetical protein
MATFTLSATVGATTLTRSKTLSDTDAGRLLTWAKAQYGSSLTNAQAFAAMSDAILSGLRDNVLNYERDQAAQTAQSGVADIVLS